MTDVDARHQVLGLQALQHCIGILPLKVNAQVRLVYTVFRRAVIIVRSCEQACCLSMSHAMQGYRPQQGHQPPNLSEGGPFPGQAPPPAAQQPPQQSQQQQTHSNPLTGWFKR